MLEPSAGAPRPALDHAMPEYLITVRCPDGRKITERVPANSADEAVQYLHERGYDEVVLHSDDIQAQFTRQRAKTEQISADDVLMMRNRPFGVGLFLVTTIQGYKKMGFAIVSTALCLAWFRYGGRLWGFWDSLCLVILLLPPTVGLVATIVGIRARAPYRRMVDALYSGRWEECIRRADRLGARVPPHEIAVRRAQALARLDRLDEALQLVKLFGDGKAVPPWFYHLMLAQVNEFARRPDEAIGQLEQAIELAPDNATIFIALARFVIWHKRDARRARELLTEARAHAMSDLTIPTADALEGLILLEEGRPREALSVLEASYKILHSRRHLPLGYLPMEQAMLGLALTHAALGESDVALKLYGKVRPRLVALQSYLLDRCDRAIGRP
jgi:Tetratricopeptide repeat